MSQHEAEPVTYGLMAGIAQSGECMDCWAIEGKLKELGFGDAAIRQALANADDRKALLAMCVAARTTAREQERMKDDAAFRELIAQL